jgi:hypothetical protein
VTAVRQALKDSAGSQLRLDWANVASHFPPTASPTEYRVDEVGSTDGAYYDDKNHALNNDVHALVRQLSIDDSLAGEEVRQLDEIVDRDLGAESEDFAMEIWYTTSHLQQKTLRIAAAAIRIEQSRSDVPLIAQSEDTLRPINISSAVTDEQDKSREPPKVLNLKLPPGGNFALPYERARKYEVRNK